MPAYETIRLETAPSGVATLTLNRPDRLNAATARMFDELADAVEMLNADASLAAVIVTGAGRAFCAGRDRDELDDVNDADRTYAIPKPGGLHSDMLRALQMPTIAAINGAAVGAGLGFAFQCDVRIAAAEAVFLDGHLAAGLSPSIASWYLPRLCGTGPALQFFCRRTRIDAAAARDLGIVSEVVPGPELMSRAAAIAADFAQWDGELLRHTKRLATLATAQSYEDTMERVGLLRGLRARASVPAAKGAGA